MNLADEHYTISCKDTVIKVMELIYDVVTNKMDTVYRSKDTITCRIQAFSEAEETTLHRCDTTTIIIKQVREYDSLVMVYSVIDNDFKPELRHFIDTLNLPVYDIRCYEYDTLYAYDTFYNAYYAEFADTVSMSDEMFYGGLIGTDTLLTVCPRLTQTYVLYDSTTVGRLRDSADYYEQLAVGLEQAIADGTASRGKIEVFVPQDVLDALEPGDPLPDDQPYAHAQQSAAAARARAAAYTAQADRLQAKIDKGQHTRSIEHILDTLHLVLDGETT
ncbi:MAG: hypothetical protein K2H70_05720, partial [Bacteroidales bacterium]|nr:hypothetical protein [Bacteroidales bacterium]